MQNKGAILTLPSCLLRYVYTSFRLHSKPGRLKSGPGICPGNPDQEFNYLDSISGEEVYNFIGLKKFTTKR